MNRFLCVVWIFTIIGVNTIFAQSPKYDEIAITNITVIPMDSNRLIPNQTILIRQGVISAMGSVKAVNVPKNYLKIDGTNDYLMPGLVNMHVHLTSDMFPLFIANGVTTVREMSSTPEKIFLRDVINERELIGPTIYLASNLIDGKNSYWPFASEVETAEEARKEVLAHKKAGVDFIKVYNKLSIEAYESIIKTAKEQGLPVVGHVPKAVGLKRVLESGQKSIEHLYGYRSLATEVPVSDRKTSELPQSEEKNFQINEEELQNFVQKTKKNGVWNCPTLVVFNGFAPSDVRKRFLKRPEMKYLSPMLKEPRSVSKFYHQFRAIDKHIIKALYKEGAKLLLGTDVGNPLVVPGFSEHEELQLLVDAGLSPYDALKTGTYDAAEFLNALDDLGTVAIGKQADLILLKANPLKSISNTRKIRGVVLKGQWISEKEIQNMLKDASLY